MTTTTTSTTTTAVPALDGLLEAVRTGTGVPVSLFAPDVELDATVPGWRLHRHGAASVAAHHCHVLRFDADGRIAGDRFFCGGRWDAALLAQMAAAE